MRVRVDRSKLRPVVRRAIAQQLQRRSGAIGSTLVSQVRRRFDDGGDEAGRWPDLAVNDPNRLAKLTSRSSAANRERGRQVKLAETNLARIEKRIESGELTGRRARTQKARAKERRRRARDIERAGTTDAFRGGGEPLRDRGTLRASFTFAARNTGRVVRVAVGSPDPRAAWHQSGYTTKGPNYIPLTKRAQRGWSEKLVPGYDYAIAPRGVTVPARPMVRLTRLNRQDIKAASAGRR